MKPVRADPPFPFLGAGEASYFERAEVQVRFVRAPTDRARRALEAGRPAPLAQLEWRGALLIAASTRATRRGLRAPTFNAALEAWLRRAHALLPVLVAHRAEDLEAGGTTLSPWHQQSLEALPRTLEALLADAQPSDADLGGRLLAWAKAAKVKLPTGLSARVRALGELEAQREAEAWEQAGVVYRAQLARLDADAATDPRRPLTGAPRTRALGALAQVLPRLAKRLEQDGQLFTGATEAQLKRVEKQLGQRLAPDHRALLAASDGLVLGPLTVAGGGGSGAKNLWELSNVYGRDEESELVFITLAHALPRLVQLPLGSSKPFVQERHLGEVLESGRLEALLEHLLDAR